VHVLNLQHCLVCARLIQLLLCRSRWQQIAAAAAALATALTSRRFCADARTTTAARRAGLAAATRVLQAQQHSQRAVSQQHADRMPRQSVDTLLSERWETSNADLNVRCWIGAEALHAARGHAS
jgi:hypothetical protein